MKKILDAICLLVTVADSIAEAQSTMVGGYYFINQQRKKDAAYLALQEANFQGPPLSAMRQSPNIFDDLVWLTLF